MDVSKDLFRSPGASPKSTISAFTPPSPLIVAAGVGMVLGQDVVQDADGTKTSPIKVEALVPGESLLCIFESSDFPCGYYHKLNQRDQYAL